MFSCLCYNIFWQSNLQKSLSIVKDFNFTPKLFCLLQDNICNNLLYKYDLSRKTVTIKYVPKTKLVFVLDVRSLLFKESERKWRVGKKEKKKRKGKNEGEDRSARFPHFRLTPPPSHHLTRLTWSNIGYLNP